MGDLNLTIVTLKGFRFPGIKVDSQETVGHLMHVISHQLHGQNVDDMRLVYRAKYLSDPKSSLASCGVRDNHELHLVTRFSGGGGDRPAVQEVAHQLKSISRTKLCNLELVSPQDDMSWNLLLRGPKGTPYSRGLYSLTFDFPDNYPYSPPRITFNTPIYHPNVYTSGMVCWHDDDSSGSKYSADILVGAINALLEAPNVDSPANSEAACLYTMNNSEYFRRAKAMADEYAFK